MSIQEAKGGSLQDVANIVMANRIIRVCLLQLEGQPID